jgi:hypothetical protein
VYFDIQPFEELQDYFDEKLWYKGGDIRELAKRVLNATGSKIGMLHSNRDYSGALQI